MTDAENVAKYQEYLLKFHGIRCPECNDELSCVSTLYHDAKDDLISKVELNCGHCFWSNKIIKKFRDCLK